MHIYCHICHGKLSIMDDYRFVKGLFIHRMTLFPNGDRRYCYNEYKQRQGKGMTPHTMSMAD